MGSIRKSQHHPPDEHFGRQHDERGRCEHEWRRAHKHVELEINYTATKVEHTLPLMCKWFDKFHKGNNKSDVSYIDENSSDVCSDSQRSMGSLAQTAIANTASGSSGWVVNIKHEKMADLRARIGQKVSENQLNGGRDVLSSMATKAATDSSLLHKRQDRLTVDRATNAVVRLPMSGNLVFYLCVLCCALCAVCCVRCTVCTVCRVSCVVCCAMCVVGFLLCVCLCHGCRRGGPRV